MKTSLKAAGLRLTKQQTDAIDTAFRSAIALSTGGGTVVEVILSADQDFAYSALLVDASPKLCFIGGTLVKYDFSDTDVFDPSTGTHQLGQTFPENTEITYLI
jgi:hypothetical protein